MASGRIKGITIEIGGDTTKLDKALADTDKQLRATQTNLKDVERLLKMDPGNIDLLTQKQRLLTDAVAGTKERLGTLEAAAAQANQQLAKGDISQQQFDALNREIIETKMRLEEAAKAADEFDVGKAVQDAQNALNGLGDAASGTAGDLGKLGSAAGGADGDVSGLGSAANGATGDVSGLGGAANGAAGDLGGLGNAAGDASGELGGLKGASGGLSGGLNGLAGIAGGVAIAIGQKLVEAAIEAAKWMWELDEATEEYREAMGKLNTAYESSGFSAGTAKEAYEGFYRILGDTDTATEASQLLANMYNREEALTLLTGMLSDEYGALAKDIPIDALIQAANETAKTGKVTGVLAEAIERAGGSSEDLEDKLAEMKSGSRLAVVAGELSTALFDDGNEAERASLAFQSLAVKTDSLAKWTKIAAGVYGTFGDSLPIEGLIEAANETAKTGKVTGVLADALNWVGISEDNFNDILSTTSDEGKKAELIMGTLGMAYKDAADSFSKNNETLIQSREAQMQLDEAQAKLGESVAALKNKFFELFGPALIGLMTEAAHSMEGLVWLVDKIGQALDWLGDKIQKVIGFFKDLFGAGQQASGMSVDSGGSSRARVTETSYALRTATAENLPYLARGTVTRPNNPFLAVVGDNPTEPEIVSPLSTMRQAVRDELDAANTRGSAPRNANITLVLNGAVLGRAVVPLLDDYNNLRGVDLAVE